MLEQQIEEEICTSLELDEYAGGQVPTLVTPDSNSDSDAYDSEDKSILGSKGVPQSPAAP